ncbi:transglycosylase SLT domain-containing protein [Pokkaliibacter sp. CJK22405]|uniref:transglycosylase SLT domain-containing protein n=1 Tax=Pokkaliibacter sp. CJK22405 TaxID=3384615 RepID=UPI0039855F33
MRQQYVQAQQLFDSGKLGEARALTRQLESYPLYPYLAYRELMSGLGGLKKPSLENFQKRYPDFPLQKDLYSSWLNYLVGAKRWKDFAYASDDQKLSANLSCWRAFALYQLKRNSDADALTKDLWLSGKSQPDTCDAPFNTFKSRKKLTQNLIEERMILALSEDESGLAKYLAKQLSGSTKAHAEAMIALSEHPETVSKYIEALKKRPGKIVTDYYVDTLKQYGRAEPEAALAIATHHGQKLFASDKEKNETVDYLLGRLAIKAPDRYLAATKQYQRPAEDDDAQRVLRYWLGSSNWPMVKATIATLPKDLQAEERWKYWEARSLGETGNDLQARTLFTELAKERSFYGYASAQRLGLPYQLNHQPLPVSSERQREVMGIPAIARAVELRILDQEWQSRREWYRALDNMPREQKVAAARLADQWGWYFVSIFTMAKAAYWDDVQVRFPMAYSQDFVAAAQNVALDPDWVIAISRQESAFRYDANSPVGARGLMQLMPATAKHTIRKFNLPDASLQDLYNPDINIKIGSHYLSEVNSTFSNNRILATAAYNAGPSRVSRWLNERGQLPADIWIETIPFNETRKYVQNVLTYAVIYQKKLGRAPELIKPSEMQLTRNVASNSP